MLEIRKSTRRFPRGSRAWPLVLLMLMSPALAAMKCSQVQPTQPGRVVLISVDGLAVIPTLTALLGASEPRVEGFQRLIDEGASTLNARADPDKTRTGPGHFGMLTGRYVWRIPGGPSFCAPNEHGWFFNDNQDELWDTGLQDLNPACPYIDSIISMASKANLTTRMLASKGPCVPGVAGRFCHFLNSWCPTRTAGDPDCHFDSWTITNLEYDTIEDQLLNDPWPRLTFFHHALTDLEGHLETVNSEAYRNALGRVSDLIIDVMNTVPVRTTVIVTTDHGHGGGPDDPVLGCGTGSNNGRTHTCNTAERDYTVPLFVWDRGKEWAPGSDLYDLFPSLCDPGTAFVDQDAPCQPVRIQHVARIASDALHIAAPNGAMDFD